MNSMKGVGRVPCFTVPEGSEETSTASEDFKENILGRKRYVDKTSILVPLLKRTHETTFFLRPRRFGKTLTLSMLHYYLEDTRDEKLNAENRGLFEGMQIMSEGEFYVGQMTQYPVIHLTFQSVKGDRFETAYSALVSVIRGEYHRHRYALDEGGICPEDKVYFKKILESIVRKEDNPLPVSDLVVSLLRLSEYLASIHGRKTVVLLDEYDVPLEKAHYGGYYREMVNVISPLLQNVLKTNSANLQFAVVTGCLRIAKESIYTGLNNPEVNTVLSDSLSDALGFTEEEVKNLLSDSGFPDRYEEMREWYDGYRFGQGGKTVIYNPWSVIKRIEELAANSDSIPSTPWAGTSSNIIIRELAERGAASVKEKAEALMRGEAITFRERDDIVYSELDYHDDNVFSVMLHTGYLTNAGFDGDNLTAVIPNREVRKIYRDQISEWFRGTLGTFDVRKLYQALERGDEVGAKETERILVTRFLASMSYFDSQEAYYHGVLLALLQLNEGYLVTSNREAGKGRFDLACRERGFRRYAIILEVKCSKTSKALYADAGKGASQAKTKKYAVEVLREGYETVITYGVSFYRKDCAVRLGQKYTQGDLDGLILARKKRR
ncbi:MAG: AAA family ATPase [Lachnospiraceae bacterium]|nr:AAA family ATPase [Lachnospiraceae bacterium]